MSRHGRIERDARWHNLVVKELLILRRSRPAVDGGGRQHARSTLDPPIGNVFERTGRRGRHRIVELRLPRLSILVIAVAAEYSVHELSIEAFLRPRAKRAFEAASGDVRVVILVDGHRADVDELV